MHINEVSKNVGEQGNVQSLVEIFIGQATNFQGIHQLELQTCMISFTYVIEILKGKKIIVEANIIKFLPRKDLEENINNYKREWKIIGKGDERIQTHLLPLNLDNFPNRWYKIEEDHGDNSTWNTLKQNFINDFSFNTQKQKLKDATKLIKEFIQDPSTQQVDQNKDDLRTMTSCNQVIKDQNHCLASQLELETNNPLGKSF